MTQTIISNNLAGFLKSTTRQMTPKIQEKINMLTKNGGLCFGYALGFSVKRSLGKRIGWQQYLITVANAKNEPYSSRKIFKMGDGREKNVSLKRINQCVLYFTLKFQHPEGQSDFFLIDGYFKVRHQGKVLSFAKQVSVAGYFSKNNIKKLLDPVSFHPKHVNVVSGVDHSVTIWYENKQWYLYDPNNDSTKKEKIVNRFENKHELVDALVDRLGSSLTIQIGLYNKQILPIEKAYDKIIQNSSGRLFKGHGFHEIIFGAPHKFDVILENAVKTQEGLKALKKSLLRESDYKRSGIKLLSAAVPDKLEKVLHYVDAMNDPDIYSEFSRTDANSCNTLHCVALFAPQAFSFVLACLVHNNPDLDDISDLLTATQDTGKNVFDSYFPGTECIEYKGLRFFSDGRYKQLNKDEVKQPILDYPIESSSYRP